MTKLSGDLVRHKLPTYTFGQNVVYTDRIGSTNTELKKFARQGAPEGLLYLTDEQTTGRGRLDRDWYAPPGSSLLMSLLFRPAPILKPTQAQQVTMLSALALGDAIKTHTQLEILLKWPNDLVWQDHKKLGGILTELEIKEDRLAWVVVGLGLNVNLDFKKLSRSKSGNGAPPLEQTATSLSTILDQDTAHLRLPILQKFLFNVEQRYKALEKGISFHQEWRDRLIGLGQSVTVWNVDGSKQEGLIHDVDADGALLLKEADGTIVKIFAGEVTLQKRP